MIKTTPRALAIPWLTVAEFQHYVLGTCPREQQDMFYELVAEANAESGEWMV